MKIPGLPDLTEELIPLLSRGVVALEKLAASNEALADIAAKGYVMQYGRPYK